MNDWFPANSTFNSALNFHLLQLVLGACGTTGALGLGRSFCVLPLSQGYCIRNRLPPDSLALWQLHSPQKSQSLSCISELVQWHFSAWQYTGPGCCLMSPPLHTVPMTMRGDQWGPSLGGPGLLRGSQNEGEGGKRTLGARRLGRLGKWRQEKRDRVGCEHPS
jgi:hypothetical protein